MAGEYIILNFLIYALLIYGVLGETGKTSPEQLQAQPKLPVKTVKTEHGDIYDCIDFFEQPAFDHPLLKNHDYHFDMKPSFVPNEILDNAKDKMKDKFKPKKVGCPRGTIPIRRATRENFTEGKPSRIDSQTNKHSRLTHSAGTTTKDEIGKIYGASAIMSLENPRVYEANQSSSSVISIGGGGHEFLHVGWTVNPQLYGDYNTRFYIWMHAANQSCYNANCPGFVIVNTNYPLDTILIHADSTDETVYELKFVIYQDTKDGNWWVVGLDNQHMGFWPKHLFNTLLDGAKRAYYGGAVVVTSGDTNFPQMGTGSRPDKNDTRGNAFSRHISIVNQNGTEEYAAPRSNILESLNDRYVAQNFHMPSYDRKHYWASTILFGGH